MKYRHFLWLVAMASLLVIVFFVWKQPTETPGLDERFFHWKERIESVGATAAYAHMADEIAALPIRERHAHAHAFGAALYLTRGISGLPVCDARFSYGCFHEFLGRAIADEGMSVVTSLNQQCIEILATSSPLSCQHGLGHGIQSYIGYEPDDLALGLAACRDLHNDAIGGCYGGVFMEFHFRTLWGESARIREATREEIERSCKTVDEEYERACLYWSPQWWLQALFEGDPRLEHFATLGDICLSVAESEELRRDCFEGIGVAVPSQVGYNPQRVVQACTAVAANPRYQLHCRASAANILHVDAGQSAALKSCEGLTGVVYQYCAAYAKNQANIFNRALLSE